MSQSIFRTIIAVCAVICAGVALVVYGEVRHTQRERDAINEAAESRAQHEALLLSHGRHSELVAFMRACAGQTGDTSTQDEMKRLSERLMSAFQLNDADVRQGATRVQGKYSMAYGTCENGLVAARYDLYQMEK